MNKAFARLKQGWVNVKNMCGSPKMALTMKHQQQSLGDNCRQILDAYVTLPTSFGCCLDHKVGVRVVSGLNTAAAGKLIAFLQWKIK